MNKKVISAVLAGAMSLTTLGMTAFAADPEANTETGNNTLSAKAGLLEAKIKAIIPSSLEASINPYGATVTAEDTTAVVSGVKYADGLVSPTYKIQNLDADAGLKVTATAKITPSSTVAVNTKLLDDAKLQKATEKQVFAFLNTTTDEAGADKPIFANTKFVGNEHQVAFTEEGAKAVGIMSIDKGKADGTVAGYFYVGGQCTPSPETAWNTKDTVTLDLILDLSPSMGDPADLTLDTLETATGTKIEKEFDGAKTSYTLVAANSKTKYTKFTVTAAAGNTVVYAKYNGKLYASANATASATDPKVSAPVTADPDVKGTITVEPKTVDYAAGDVLEFIVVNAATNESTTYTITFE